MSRSPVVIFHEDDDVDNAQQRSCGKCRHLRCSALTRSMDVLSMIKHSIIADEANPITHYFDIRQHTASCGPEMIWKIHDAVRIKDNKEASVFIFEKKIADKLHKPRRRETVSEILRREVQMLEKLKHPHILTVLHQLEECHNSLAFATEPIFASLANLLGNIDRMPIPINQDIKEHEFIELEIKYGILQITESLSYLHGMEQYIHRNVCPQSILVTKRGSWKLAGFGFAERLKDGKDSIPAQPWSGKMSKMTQPNLNFLAPEVQTDKKASCLGDMFSLGMTICTTYNAGVSPISADYNTQLYAKHIDQLTQVFGEIAHKMPLALVEPIEKMINKDTRYRPTAQLFSLLKYFHDPLVVCLKRLDTLDLCDSIQQSEVYSNLIQVIPSMPRCSKSYTTLLRPTKKPINTFTEMCDWLHQTTRLPLQKVLYNHVFPTLLEACHAPDTMIFALPSLLTLIDFAPRDEYIEIILPEFRNILGQPKPIQATIFLLDKVDIILAKSPTEEIKTEVIPLVFNTLDSNCIQAQEVALGAIGLVREYLDDSIMKNIVLPRAKSLFNKSDNIKMRINALTCIDNLLDSLDKMMILDEVLPFLMDIQCQDAKIVMAVVGIYKHILSDKKFGLTHNLIATRVMPPLIPQTVNPGLSMEQFSALMEVLHEMLSQIDRERRNKMRQETVTVPIPQRGLINMQAGSQLKDGSPSSSRSYLSVEDAVLGMQKSRTEFSLTSLPGVEPSRPTNTDSAVRFSKRVPATPESPRSQPANTPKLKPKTLGQNSTSATGSLDENLSVPHPGDSLPRRHSLAPPPAGGGPAPIISLTSDESPGERPRRPSAQSLGPFSFSDPDRRGSRGSIFGSLGVGDTGQPQRRASFQALGESVMQLFSGK